MDERPAEAAPRRTMECPLAQHQSRAPVSQSTKRPRPMQKPAAIRDGVPRLAKHIAAEVARMKIAAENDGRIR